MKKLSRPARSVGAIPSLIRSCAVAFSLPILFGVSFSIHAAAPVPDTSSEVHSAGQIKKELDASRLIHKDVNKELDIPPVFQRPLGVDAGDRIHVRRFYIKGVIDHPAYGINQGVVDEYVESLRIEIQNLNTMNEFGLSEDDMKAMGKQLQETLYEDDEKALQEHAKFLKKLRQAKRYREEMSIGQLQEVANKLTDFYRKQGLVIAQVFVPEQTIEDGVVTLHVLEGILGETIVENNKDYSADLLKSPFKGLEHKFVSKSSLENALLELSDFPGLIAYGVLQPGVEQGETDLLVKVQEEIKHQYTVKLDNYGTDTTGDIRLLFSYKQNNVFGKGDVFDLNLLQSFSPTNSLFGGVDYKSPTGFRHYDYNVGFSSNTFDVGGDAAASGISGDVIGFDVGLDYRLKRSRRSNSGIGISFENKTARTFIKKQLSREDAVSTIGLSYTFDNLDVVNQGINQGSINLYQGIPGLLGSLEDATGNTEKPSRKSGDGTNAISDFTKLTWNFARLQLISKYQNILIKTDGQLTGDIIPPVEQFGIGGPTNVRSFATSEFLADNAIYIGVDWNFNAPGFFDEPAFDTWKWGEIFQLSVFGDFAAFAINEPRVTDKTPMRMAGVGVAAQMVLPGRMTIRFDVSTPVLNNSGIGFPNKQGRVPNDTQFYLTFSYSG